MNKLFFAFFALYLSACSTTAQSPARNVASEASEMEYVELCRRKDDCKQFSRLVMGTDHLVQADWQRKGQPEISEAELNAILDEAARLGINLYDTSPIYVGGVENKLGKWLKSRKDQGAKLYALSKGGFPFDLFYTKKLDPGTHSPQIKQALKREGILGAPAPDGSIDLQNVPPGTYASRLYGDKAQIVARVADELGHTSTNLNNDIAIYLMHRDDNDYLRFKEIPRRQASVETIMEALSAPEIAGKFWGLGWSNWETLRVDESVRLANERAELSKPLLNSPYFSLFEMTSTSIHAGGVQVRHREMMNPDFQKGIKLMPYSPLGGFSIFDKPEPIWENAKKDAKAKFDARDPYWQNVYPAVFTPANEARFKRVVEFTKKFNEANKTSYTLDQMINAYALAHKRMDFLAVGPITVEQLRRTVASLKLARMLSQKDLEYLYSGR